MAVETPPPARQTTRQIARSTVIVMVAFAVAKIISLAQTFIITGVFGLSSEWGAFVSANRIPELIFTLIAGGALAYAFIPIFSSFLARGDNPGAWRTASHVINTIFCATLIASILAFFAAPWLVGNLVAPGFTPEVQAQTVELMRILLVSTLIFSVSGIIMGILQSFNHFLLPALAPIMFDLGILFGVIFLLPRFGVNGIAIGAVIGAAGHLLIQVPGLIRFRARWLPELGLRDPNLHNVIRLMIPRIGGLGVFSFNFIIMNNIASRMGENAVAALDWGWRLMQIPETLIGTAMGTVIFPALAALSEQHDDTGKRSAMSGALRFVLIATIPSAIGMILIGRPLISLLERGAFDSAASDLVYSTLQFFTLGLITHSALEIVARSYYADKDTLTPLMAAMGGAAINLVLSIALTGVNPFDPFSTGDQSDVGYLALANSIGVGFEVVVLLIILRRRWGGIEENALARAVGKTLAASLVMGLVVVVVNTLWAMLGLTDRGIVWTIAQLAVTVGGGGAAFVATAWVLKMEELRAVLNMVRRRRPLTEAVA